MSKGKKQAFTLLGLCVLMVAAICLYFIVPRGDSEESAEEGNTAETVNVAKIEKDKITSVSITGEGREDISLEKNGEDWKLKDMPDVSLDADTVEGMFSGLSPVTASKELDSEGVQLSDYGLDQPQMTVKIATSDGEEYEFRFGGTVPVTGGNYGLTEDGGKIYTFSETLYSAFDIEKNSLIAKEEVADINSDYLTSISVKNDGKETFKAEVVSDSKKVDAYTNWVISKPYKKLLAGSSTEDWTTLEGFFTSVTLGDLVEYGCSDFGKYGLKKPSSTVEVGYFEVKDGYEIPEATAAPDSTSQTNASTNKASEVPEEYRENKGYTLYIGKKADSGDYYVRLKGSKNVYTMSASNVENMTGADAYTYMDKCVYSTLATDIKGYDAVIGDKKISVTRSTEKGDDGKDKNVWTLNGEKVSDEKEEAFLTPYSKAYLLEFTSKAKDSVKPESDRPVMTIVYHEEGRDVTVKYLPYDGTNFYRVDKDGMDYFLVDKRSVDDTVASFESLLELDQSEKK